MAAAVELRRPAGAGPGAAGGALEADLDDAGVGQLVEVEGGDGAGDAERVGGLVPGRPAVALGQQPVEVAPQGLVERGDAGDAVLEVGGGSMAAF